VIVYLETKARFVDDVFSNQIEDKVFDAVKSRLGIRVAKSEVNSWKNSLGYMQRILVDETIPADAGVAIEYSIPQTSKRIDFILTGKSSTQKNAAVIVELKQWSDAELTGKDAVVSTFLGGQNVETNHPSYQAWSYAALLEDFNEAARAEDVSLHPCAYLHNCAADNVLKHPFYRQHTAKAPVFLKADAAKLKEFIKQHVKRGDAGELMYRIRDGKIRPSKNLADMLLSLLQGNQEFLMIDDQKLVYETALDLAEKSTDDSKNVLIVSGGPGTGKSVVAINLLVELTARERLAQYVTKNSAPRSVYEAKLAGTFTKSRISNLFKGSGAFVGTEANAFDALVVDESHRLTDKSGLFRNKGENQVAEIIASSKLSVFFIDELQRVHIHDQGTVAEIIACARDANAEVTQLPLKSQFRCNGSDGYLAWVDNTLQIRDTANPTLDGIDYEFKVCDSPHELRDLVVDRNQVANKARMVAGFCWPWKGKKDASVKDIEIPGHQFAAKWNLANDGNLWIIKPESVQEIGCIHTCQGLELDYIGVIIGPDFVIRDGVAVTDATARASQDRSVFGYKKMYKQSPGAAEQLADQIIKNTYRTLMTRGQKGCFVYSVDAETNQYLKLVALGAEDITSIGLESYPGLPFELIDSSEVKPFANAVPIFDMQVAAGEFSEPQWLDEASWVALPEPFVAKEGFFVTRVVGRSMNKRIPDGSWCLFKAHPDGSRLGKVVLVQHRDVQDPDGGGQYTVKLYESKKVTTDHSWGHEEIILRPDSHDPGYDAMVLDPEAATELQVIGELVAVLGNT
jgi:hypothetical protein